MWGGTKELWLLLTTFKNVITYNCLLTGLALKTVQSNLRILTSDIFIAMASQISSLWPNKHAHTDAAPYG